MIIEMIATQISKDTGINLHTRHTTLNKAVGRHLYSHITGAFA